MTLFAWKPEYSVNEAVLDDHHKKLFSVLNSVYENVMNSLEVDCILPTIDELSAYTRYHFVTEELYMREKGFPGIEDHIEEKTKAGKQMVGTQATTVEVVTNPVTKPAFEVIFMFCSKRFI